MHKILYLFIYNTFIKILYMFRAVRCSSSGGLTVSMQHLVSSLSAGDCPVHRLRKNWSGLLTNSGLRVERPATSYQKLDSSVSNRPVIYSYFYLRIIFRLVSQLLSFSAVSPTSYCTAYVLVHTSIYAQVAGFCPNMPLARSLKPDSRLTSHQIKLTKQMQQFYKFIT